MADETATAVDDDAREDSHEHDPEPEPELRYGALVTWMRGQEVLHPARENAKDCLKTALDDGFLMCIDITAVDYLTFGERAAAEGGDRPVARADQIPAPIRAAKRGLPPSIEPERFEVVYNLLRLDDSSRLRVRVQLPEADPAIPTVTDLWFGADAMEREAFDMFGIQFDGHPDMTRILMPEDWVGHPLRKDYSVGAIPVQFKGVENAR